MRLATRLVRRIHDHGCPGRRGGRCECAVRDALVISGAAMVIIVILAVVVSSR
jgi:hypothetical protein